MPIFNLTNTLATLTTSQTLDLSNTPLSDSDCLTIADPIAQSQITTLNLSNCELSSDGAIILIQAVQRSTSIQNFVVQQNLITDATGPAIASLLRNSTTLRIFSVSNTGLTEISYTLLAQAIADNLNSQILQIGAGGYPGYSPNGNLIAASFATLIRKNLPNFKNLGIFRTNLTASGASQLAQAMLNSTYFTTLSLGFNPDVGDAGLLSFVDVFEQASASLKAFDFQSDNITDAGASIILALLQNQLLIDKRNIYIMILNKQRTII